MKHLTLGLKWIKFAEVKTSNMTRINSNLNPKVLNDEMLLAEHREIKRLPSEFLKRISKPNCNFKDIPTKFTLGTGHVKFFLNKPEFTLSRYKAIHEECLRRGFDVTDFSDNWKVYDNFWHINVKYVASESDIDLIRNRIKDNILKSSKQYFRYNRVKITKDEAIQQIYIS